MRTLTTSPHGSFKVSQLCESVAICEALSDDRYGWNNATDTDPAFIAYLGCSKEEIARYIKLFNDYYKCYWCEVRQPRHLKDFEAEIKVRGMQRHSDSQALGLDHLIESEQAKHDGCDYDEYQYYSTGYQPRW